MTGLRLSLCNEVIAEVPFERQCEMAAAMGYDALEVAPYTLGDEPDKLSAATIAATRRAADAAGIRISGLHWLLVKPPGLSITTDDAALHARTVDFMRRMVMLCGELDGDVLVHGSPAQRKLPEGEPAMGAARGRAIDAFAAVARAAEAAGVVYCVEPLGRRETNLVNTVEEGVAIVRAIGSTALRTMIDCSAAGQTESMAVPDLIDRWLPTGFVGHIQVNDKNRRGPGQGEERFAPIVAALLRNGYRGWVAAEPFDYHPDGPTAAARAAGYLRGIEETLAWRS